MAKGPAHAGRRQAQLGRHGAWNTSKRTPEERFGARVTPLPSGCWAFNGDLSKYASFNPGTRPEDVTKAYIYAYQSLVGPVPEGHHLHHTCLNPGCVNPAHLEPLTPEQHVDTHVALRRAKRAA